jgi:hypothetical protein
MSDLPDAILELPYAPQVDIEVRRGATHQFRFRLKVSGTALDNGGWTVAAEITGPGESLLAAYTCTPLAPSSDGWVRCLLSAATTAALVMPANAKPDPSGLLRGVLGRYDVRITDSSGHVAFARWGRVTLVGLD